MKCLWFILILFFSFLCEFSESKLYEYFRWKQIEFSDLPDYVIVPSQSEIQNFTDYNATSYIPYSNLPVGVDRYKNRVFVTVPRRRIGIPSTLNYITISEEKPNNPSPKLNSYPDYQTNKIPSNLQPNFDRIISVYRTRVDVCGRLWFIDTGMFEYPGFRRQIQRPAIWVIDLEKNERIRRFEIPESIALLGDGFVSITVDVKRNNCDDAYAYIPNMRSFTLSVYSFRLNRIWTFRHNSFYLEPRNGDFNIQGFQFQWNDGIFSIAVGQLSQDDCKPIYYHALASLSEYVVSSCVLQNESLSQRSYHGNDFQYIDTRNPKMQSAVHGIDERTGIMITSQIHLNGIGCWHPSEPLRNNNIGVVDRNDITMIYPSDLKIDLDSNVWVMTNRIPIYAYGRLNVTDYNYRIFFANIDDALQKTVCERPHFTISQSVV